MEINKDGLSGNMLHYLCSNRGSKGLLTQSKRDAFCNSRSVSVVVVLLKKMRRGRNEVLTCFTVWIKCWVSKFEWWNWLLEMKIVDGRDEDDTMEMNSGEGDWMNDEPIFPF